MRVESRGDSAAHLGDAKSIGEAMGEARARTGSTSSPHAQQRGSAYVRQSSNHSNSNHSGSSGRSPVSQSGFGRHSHGHSGKLGGARGSHAVHGRPGSVLCASGNGGGSAASGRGSQTQMRAPPQAQSQSPTGRSSAKSNNSVGHGWVNIDDAHRAPVVRPSGKGSHKK